MEGTSSSLIKALSERETMYRPRFTKLTGRVTASILLRQILYYWENVSKGRPFYKFRAPCQHDRYVEDDSWLECLGFSPAEFDTALKTIGTKITKGTSRTEALGGKEICNIVLYWTDSNRTTWYELNEPLLAELLYNLYSDEANSGKCKYLDVQEGDTSIESENPELHSSQIPQTNSVTAPKEARDQAPELEYVDVDEEFEDNPHSRKRPKWQIPETQAQKDFLAICNAKWFEPKQKGKVKALLKAFEAGDIAGRNVYHNCLYYLEDKTELVDVPPLMPRDWFVLRATQATQHHWKRDGLIRALLDRDKLVEHCQIQQRLLDRAPPRLRTPEEVEAALHEELPTVITIPDDGTRYLETTYTQADIDAYERGEVGPVVDMDAIKREWEEKMRKEREGT